MATTDAQGLDRLNDAERRVLRLLAEGHTAKSIAVALGTTVAAVNERLREGRRKTGVGSSRELARLLRAQESRDEQIGMAGKPGLMVPAKGTSRAPAASSRKGLLAMTALLLTALLAAFALQQDPSAGGGQSFSDPIVGDILAPMDPAKAALIPTTERDDANGRSGENIGAALSRLHAEVRGQRQADAATEEAERRLAAIIKSIHPMKLSGAPLRVLCSPTVCEVATTTGPRPSAPAIDAHLNALQGLTLREEAEKAGFVPLYLHFGHHPTKLEAVYLGYWSRKP